MQYVVIPARYGSTRLLGKPLLRIGGKYVIHHVLDQVSKVFNFSQVRVATDNDLISKACEMYGVKSILTNPNHTSGTSRIQEVAEIEGWADSTQIINVQGDEPFIPPDLMYVVQKSLQTLLKSQSLGMATLSCDITNLSDVFNPNVVKVVISKSERALYFSRAAIPWDRDRFHYDVEDIDMPYSGPAKRHIGIYAYNVKTLNRISKLQSEYETTEKLEQLALLENDIPIICKNIKEAPVHGIDTRADLNAAQKHWEKLNPGFEDKPVYLGLKNA